MLDIIQYIADGRSSSSNDAYVHLALRNHIVRNLEYYKKYDLIEELSYVSRYLFLNKDEANLDFGKKARRKFFW